MRMALLPERTSMCWHATRYTGQTQGILQSSAAYASGLIWAPGSGRRRIIKPGGGEKALAARRGSHGL